MTRVLSVQIQPHRSDIDMQAVGAAFETILRTSELIDGHSFERGEDEGEYSNYSFSTSSLSGLWSLISSSIYSNPDLGPAISACSIVTCEGSRGWDDYLLLHHFDPDVVTQSV